MIDTTKLIPRRKEGARLSERTITTIGLVKKDVVKIDSLLKEKLVLSKVRYGILRQQNENKKRSGRERSLESKKSRPQDYDVNLRSNKRGKGFGGFLGGIFKAILLGLGFSIFKSLPTLLKIGKIIKVIAVPFTLAATVLIGAIKTIASVGSKLLVNTRGLNPRDVSRSKIDGAIGGFINVLRDTLLIFAGGSLLGAGVSRLARGRVQTERQYLVDLENKVKGLEKTKGKIRPVRTRIPIDGDIRPVKKDAVFDRIFTIDDLAEDIYLERSGRRIRKKMGKGELRPVTPTSKFNPDQMARMQMGAAGEDSNFMSTQATKMDTPKRPFSFIATGEKRVMTPPAVFLQEKRIKQSMNPFVRALQPEFDVLARSPIFIGKTEIEKDKLLRELMREERDRLAKTPLDAIRKQDKLLYGRIIQAKKDIAKERAIERITGAKRKKRLDAKIEKAKLGRASMAGTGRSGSGVTITGKVGEKIIRRPDGTSTLDAYKAAQRQIFGKEFKKTGMEIGLAKSKKGLSRILFNLGGEALEQSVKQTIKASVGVVPIIGDLIGLLLDVFLFGQPVGRAAFMAGGSFLGSLIGGVFGLIGGPPGALVGGIIGGIGGDLLGGALYDLIFKTGAPAMISTQLGQSAVKKGVKTGISAGFMKGGYVRFGGIVHAGEFVIDSDSTRAIERQAPGFLSALNKAKGSQVNQVLETYMSYGGGEGEGSETLIPLPFEKVVTRTIAVGGESRDTGDFTSPFIDLYRRG